MTGSGDNTLKLNLDDLLDASTSTNILKVLGNSGDEVIALMMIVSSPTPALKTSIPPLPVRVSLPAPATKISSLVVPVRVLAFLSPR
jgi:hypothetical protein